MADPFATDQALVHGATRGAWFTPAHPTAATYGDPPLRILIAGVDSEIFKKADDEYQDRQMARVLRAGVPRVEDISVIDRNREMLAACTIAWENLEEHGAPLPCNHSNALRLYQLSHIYDQAIQFMRDRRNFFDETEVARLQATDPGWLAGNGDLPATKAEGLADIEKKRSNGRDGDSESFLADRVAPMQ